jgi:hypothetical protein
MSIRYSFVQIDHKAEKTVVNHDHIFFLKLTCPIGFLMDMENKICYLVLNESNSFWTSTTKSCAANYSYLVEFDSDSEVQGLIKLINLGKTC